MKRNSILIVCAHPDDHIFGPGGTLVKYAQQGKDIYTVVFSYGELSHPHIKKEFIIKDRVKEVQKADAVLGAKGVFFMGLTEEQTAKARDDKKLQKRLKRIILKYKPEKIFTHSPNDPHPIHKVTASQLLNAYDSMNFKCEVYSFDVWNPFNTHKHKKPRLVVDISDTFKIKLKALKIFKTQWVTMVSLLWSVYFKAFINGLKNDVRFAEVFYRIR